jgi:hypothetical protein
VKPLNVPLATILAAIIVVSGCMTQQSRQPHVDAALLQSCPIAEPARYTNSETIRVANARKAALVQCNKDKASIREALQ